MSTGETANLELVKGAEYTRKQIHDHFGGQAQGGIRTPRAHPAVLLFISEQGREHGHADGWHQDGFFHYTGEGQSGDMELVRGNAAIVNHRASGESLLLFEHTAQENLRRFGGRFEYVDHHEFRRPDKRGVVRKAIIFRLRAVDGEEAELSDVEHDRAALAFERMRTAATAAANEESAERVGLPTERERSRVVRSYVLQRANGFCELCGCPAPFTRRDGAPYLESHHIERRADEGLDHPRVAAALCPNCHRKAHHSPQSDSIKATLLARIAALEQAVEDKRLSVVTAVVLMNVAGWIWIGQRKSERLDGKWEFPGGKVIEEETLEEGLRREIAEELGLELGRLEPFTVVEHDCSHTYLRMYVFLSPVAKRGVRMELRAHAVGRWTQLGSLGEHELADADQKAAKKLIERFLMA